MSSAKLGTTQIPPLHSKTVQACAFVGLLVPGFVTFVSEPVANCSAEKQPCSLLF